MKAAIATHIMVTAELVYEPEADAVREESAEQSIATRNNAYATGRTVALIRGDGIVTGVEFCATKFAARGVCRDGYEVWHIDGDLWVAVEPPRRRPAPSTVRVMVPKARFGALIGRRDN